MPAWSYDGEAWPTPERWKTRASVSCDHDAACPRAGQTRLPIPLTSHAHATNGGCMNSVSAGRLSFRLATEDDADGVMTLLEAAAEWLVSRDIRQWIPGEMRLDWLRERIAAGEVWVVTLHGVLAGSFRLIWSDEATWGAQPDEAGYVHGLVVNREFAGQEVGRRMLERAEAMVAATGRAYLRLDCLTPNDALVSYYQRAGFTLVREKRFTRASVSLFQKRVG